LSTSFSIDQQGKYSRISVTVDHLLGKLKIKSAHVKNKDSCVPKIQISDCEDTKNNQNENGEFEMDYEKLFKQASEAQIYLEQLLNNNCKHNSYYNCSMFFYCIQRFICSKLRLIVLFLWEVIRMKIGKQKYKTKYTLGNFYHHF